MDGIFGIVDSEFDMLTKFYFCGWVFGDLGDIFGILDSAFVIWDDYLVFN